MNSSIEKFGEDGEKVSLRAPFSTVSELLEKFKLQSNNFFIGRLAYFPSDLIEN